MDVWPIGLRDTLPIIPVPLRLTLRRRSHGDGVSNTAYIERLNATFRERLAPLARRCRALARHTLTRQRGMSLIGTGYTFCTPHASLSSAGATTPAMAAGITDHGWTIRALLALPVPPPRWTPPQQRERPSHALKRLMAQWCGDHGELWSYHWLCSPRKPTSNLNVATCVRVDVCTVSPS